MKEKEESIVDKLILRDRICWCENQDEALIWLGIFYEKCLKLGVNC